MVTAAQKFGVESCMKRAVVHHVVEVFQQGEILMSKGRGAEVFAAKLFTTVQWTSQIILSTTKLQAVGMRVIVTKNLTQLKTLSVGPVVQWLVQRFRSERLRVRSRRSATFTPSAHVRRQYLPVWPSYRQEGSLCACLATDVK